MINRCSTAIRGSLNASTEQPHDCRAAKAYSTNSTGPPRPDKELQTRIVSGDIIPIAPETTALADASCNPGEIATGGGFDISISGDLQIEPGQTFRGEPNTAPNTVCAQLVDVPQN